MNFEASVKLTAATKTPTTTTTVLAAASARGVAATLKVYTTAAIEKECKRFARRQIAQAKQVFKHIRVA